MRILQVGKYARERAGGVETAVYGLSAELAREHEVEVLVCSPDGTEREVRQGRLTERVVRAPLTLFSTPLPPGVYSRLRAARGFDVVQVSLQNPAAVAAVLAARPSGRLVAWYHHDIVRQRLLGSLFSPVQRAFLSRCDAIVATSREYAESSQTLREFKEKVHVIPLGVAPAAEPDAGALEAARRLRGRFGTPLFLFVGRLVYYKGLPTLLRAMVDLDARLVIVGQGPLEADLRALASRLGVAQRVFFEAVPHGLPLAPYFLACDAVVLPSSERTEAFGLSLLEGMAWGKPVVTTALGTGTTTACLDGVNGLVVEPGDAAALRGALVRLAEDPALALRLGAAGLQRQRGHFTLKAMARSFVELYGRLLQTPC